ncbi:hypothetical protein PPERSA_03457 [Pseudocohnilembus persalinus]|uniref:Peptidase C1A papain C-terminal domain-containing protein n=1 Tax=Pseudocohnilembus persalinus TaxID=266149 RepID=A0A0V0QBS1_PSEPJ|nr:hypothetical protein PPERSA_03457 [Pseudocohnilembus persalinus]|eukprot:KRW99656.1 hypothetical protein PPERSA_03457 [Pseudocohnilembus persalinus]
MKTTLALLTLLAVSSLFLFQQENINVEEISQDAELFQKFNQWIAEHGMYGSIDIASRFPVWIENYKLVQEHNAQQSDYFLKMTKFAHLTNSEFGELISSYVPTPASERKYLSSSVKADVPASVDWVAKGVSGSVQNQGVCGCCWAFSAVQTVSSLNAINSGTFTQLSQQQVVSCDHSLGLNSGCNGGNPLISMKYYIAKKGLELDSDYPFEQLDSAVVGECEYDASKVFYTNGGAKAVASKDVNAIQAAVANGPISIAINGGSIYFQLYGGGILTNTGCKANLDHAVNIVGYDTTGSTPYWNIKNSWGSSWGESGYIRIEIVEGEGICGCQADPSYAFA